MISFHIGLHKTGSTYLQKEVFPLYRECFVASGGVGECAEALRHLAGAPAAAYRPGPVRALLTELELTHRNVLLSREALGGRLWDDPIGTGLETARRIAELWSECRVVICIRKQGQMLRSVYAQYVRQGGTESPRSFLAAGSADGAFAPEYLEYDRLVQTYVDLLGSDQILVLPYERLAEDQAEAGRTIAAFVGGSFDGTCSVRRRNRSLDGWRLDVLRRWNRLFRRSRFNSSPARWIPGVAFIRYLLKATQSPWGASSPKKSWLRFLPEEQIERYRRSNQRLAELCALDLESLGYPLLRSTSSSRTQSDGKATEPALGRRPPARVRIPDGSAIATTDKSP